jgi:acetyl-CoA synthetase
MPNDMTAPSADFAANAHIDAAKYNEIDRRSGGVLGRTGEALDWIKPYTKVKNTPSPTTTSISNGSRTAR